MSDSSVRAQTSDALIIALPFALSLYPALALLATRSEVPVYLGMYSRDLLLLNGAIVCVYALLLAGLYCNGRGIQFAAVLVLCLLMLVATNNAIRDLWLLDATTQVVRLAGGPALIVVAFLADKERGARWSGIGVGVGAIMLLTALIDVGVPRLLPGDKQSQIQGNYRTAMDLSKVGGQDIVLVGDSFVWGSGVPVAKRFGDVLEGMMGAAGGARVHSLGVVGANVDGYVRQLRDVPSGKKARHVIMLFYANDMFARATLRDSIDKASVVIGLRSLSARALVDIVRFFVTPSADAYAALVLDSYDASERTFDLRWGLLERSLEAFYQTASERSFERPVLVILPMLADFETSPFDEPHRRVAGLAQQIGFRVVDSTPEFQAQSRTAEHFRAAPNDLHLNERGNAVVAGLLLRIIRTGSVDTGRQ